MVRIRTRQASPALPYPISDNPRKEGDVRQPVRVTGLLVPSKAQKSAQRLTVPEWQGSLPSLTNQPASSTFHRARHGRSGTVQRG